MRAIVDCNSFYCSCERLFRPELMLQPVVVLSNNDGCIISRSDEAKTLGVEMAGPYFKAKPLIEKYNVATFSSNYNLYGDLSWRVMETLRVLLPPNSVEVYSVDEAFLNLDHIPPQELVAFAQHIRRTVEQWTGIAVSIGVAPTKVLSKVANRLAKKHKQVTNCVLVLDSKRKIEQALHKTPVDDVWGVGYQYAEKLKKLNIHTAYDLSIKDIGWAQKKLGGVTGVRLVRELKGLISSDMEDERLRKKMIVTTRMFGSPVTDLKDIKEAVATYTSRAAEKLRRQYSAANIISVFVVPKEDSHTTYFRHGPTVSSYIKLPMATSFTQELIKPALELTERLYEKGRIYKKAGVMLSGIVPDTSVQGNLFKKPEENNHRLLMDTIDNVNFAMRDDVLKFASSGTTRNWKMRQELRSPRYTTRWDELCMVR
ncbi:MAG TPA: SOS mutagenesis and repair protein UmuC [Chitinophagaceae bacterium]|nr:SOS mutagenesis and repair protein UmuC [Chitinophagaceae bacterium]